MTTLADLVPLQRILAKAKLQEQQARATAAPIMQALTAASQATQSAQLALEQCIANLDPTESAKL